MENKCIVCGGDIGEDEGNVCETCFRVLKEKYPCDKELEKILQWHKKQREELNEEL